MASCSFDYNAKNLAVLTADGHLKVWECKSRNLRYEFTPSAHLSSTCTCLRWSTINKAGDKSRKRSHRKNTDPKVTNTSSLIALGTEHGTILLFDTLTGDVFNQLVGGHEKRVNDLCWKEDTDLIYSCSSDAHIIEWSSTTTQIKCKWKGDKHSIQSVQICSLGSFLLSAGRSIKLWDLTTKNILKKFTGHATPVTQLLFAPQALDANHNQNGEISGINGQYFISSAQTDRLVNVWKVDLDNSDQDSLVSLALTAEPVSMDIARFQQKDKPLHLAIVSQDGHLHVYMQALNGKGKKPINPTTSIQLATRGTKNVKPVPIPIIGATFTQDREPTLLMCYGSAVKPQFETLSYESFDRHVCLIREDQSNLLLGSTPASTPKSNGERVPNNVTTIGPTSSVLAASVSTSEPVRKKRKGQLATDASTTSAEESTMEERLKVMDLTPASSQRGDNQRKALPTAGSLVQMLIQALHSEDNVLLEDVLGSCNKEAIKRNTIKRLPVTLVMSFLKELIRKLQLSPGRGPQLIPWIRVVMTVHMSYLMTVPNLLDSLGGLYQLLESRVAVFNKLCKLQGRLELLLSQVTAQTQHVADEEELLQPLAVYEEEDSEEDLETISTGMLQVEDSDEWEEGSEGEKSESEGEAGEEENEDEDDEEMNSDTEG